MYYKISPLIIIISIVVVAVVGFLGVKIIMSNTSSSNTVEQLDIESSDAVPVLELTADNDDPDQESVVITATASTDDLQGITSITLPNGSKVRDDEATYEVTENGNYKFGVEGANGQTSSLTIEVNNIREASADKPYIPTGFNHIGGDPDNGYVIQDSYGNEYVWVPVSSGKLTRNTLLDTNYEESNSSATGLVNSVAQNYGFYIARFETSIYEKNGEKVAATMGAQAPWTDVTYNEIANASEKSASTFGYEGYQTAIINSYAWDTVLGWIDSSIENYSTNTGYGNYSGTIQGTGTTESDIKNNICDLAGNVREWTTEIYKYTESTTNTTKKSSKDKNVVNEVISESVKYRVVRGGSANLSRTASSHTGYKENISDPYWGSRMILYK